MLYAHNRVVYTVYSSVSRAGRRVHLRGVRTHLVHVRVAATAVLGRLPPVLLLSGMSHHTCGSRAS